MVYEGVIIISQATDEVSGQVTIGDDIAHGA